MVNFRERKVFKKLWKERTNHKVSILIGARQVGKTTLLKELHMRLKNGIFLDLDIISNYEKINTFENVLNTIKLAGYQENQKDLFYLFLDEFQRYDDLSMILKNIYDNLNNVKVYASGSSSIAIKHRIQESLAGRKIITQINPLDFEEFIWFKGKNIDLKKVRKLSGDNLYKVTSELYGLLEEFLIYGGYPEVVIEKNKKQILESIFDLYIKKDLIEYLKIGKILNVKKMIEYLAVNNGQKIKYEEISKISSLNYKQIKEYIEILKESHLIFELKPFYRNKNKEIVKIPKIYFTDNGVRNYFINNFNSLNLRDDKGFLFEGFIISETLKKGISDIKFWQDKKGHEIDMIIDNNTAIEIKFKQRLKKEDFIGLETFLQMYPSIKNAILINLNIQKKQGKVNLKLPYDLF